jgi:redox-sensitive bicupin YhaK (pirin superfamily)
MIYITEQDRKFTDMGGVKIYHSIYPIRYRSKDTAWGPIIRFDNKVLPPGHQEVQHFIGSPVQIIRVAINGTTDYYDSCGYRTVLSEQDSLVINSGVDIMSAVLQNTDDQIDTELLEIWLSSSNDETSCRFHSWPVNRKKGIFYTTMLNYSDTGNVDQQQKKMLYMGSFNAGTNHAIASATEGNIIILFVFNGELIANGQRLGYRDTVIFSGDANIQLDFETDCNLFILEIEQWEARP